MKGKNNRKTILFNGREYTAIRPGVYEYQSGTEYDQHIVPGDIMRYRRQELGMTMQDLADAIGVSKSTISRYESGGIEKLPVTHIGAIARALQVSPLYFLGFNDPDGLGEEQGAVLTYHVVNPLTVEDMARIYAESKSETDILVEKYEAAPEYIKEAIRKMLQME